jgi:lysophospholipase L1-like esterase
MSLPRRRLLAVALGCLLAAALAWAWRLGRVALREAEYEAQRRRIHELVSEHAREPRNPEARPWYLAPEDAARIFPRDRSSETYDPWSYFHHVPNRSVVVDWAEHPNGCWHWVTNSLGLRQDGELSAARPDLRVLVTGDSHTDGFCDNFESFPHVAQAVLQADRPGRSIELINAGNGGFTFHNYAGVLERFLELEPDAFVVAVYSGNDFQELLIPHAWFEHVALPEPSAAEADALARLRALSTPATTQFFHSLAWFQRHPEAVETSLAAATEIVARMRARCDAHAIRFLCLVIPAAIDLPWGANAELFEKMRLAASLSLDDLRGTERMADEFLARLRASGCDTLDVRADLRAETGPLYWQRDLHLDVRGHAVLGRALARKLESWGGRFAR